MFFVDYLIFNRDRHGANVEVLIDKNNRIRLSPLFDYGLSLLLSDYENENYINNYDIMKSEPTNSFFGTRSTFDNLKFIENKGIISKTYLDENDIKYIFNDLIDILPSYTIKRIKEFLQKRLEAWRNF